LLGLVATPLALLVPLPLKIVVDSVLDTQPLPGFLRTALPASVSNNGNEMLLLAAGLTVVASLLLHLQASLTWLLQTYAGERMTLQFRAQLFAKAQRLSISHHDAEGSVDSIYRIQYDALALRDLVINGLLPLVSSGITVAAMVYVTVQVDWQVALIALGVMPLLYVLVSASRRRLRRAWLEVKEIEKTSLSVVQNALGSIRLVKAFGREGHEEGRFLEQASAGMREHVKVALLGGGVDVLAGLIIASGTAAVLVVGARHVGANVISLGDLLLLMAYLAQLYAPLESMSKRVATMQSSIASGERALRVLDEAPDVPESPRAQPLTRAAGRLRLDSVSFGYGSQRVLDRVSLDVPAGTRLAIVGTTGAGKSTLVNLLTRFFDPTTGSILLDGTDLRDYRLADLRNQFALVLQDSVLLPGTVADNIAYGRPDATRRLIEDAARAAHAHEFISRLPNGYDTCVGERGMKLSGGERQRISLARAILKDAPILLLDEPTSSVDVETEAAIVEALKRLMRDRTTILITHRDSPLQACDVVVRMENGKLVPR
jgi:ATP-binding cassette subfamily B protein